MDVVDAIAKVEHDQRGGHGDVPVKPIYIKSAKRKSQVTAEARGESDGCVAVP